MEFVCEYKFDKDIAGGVVVPMDLMVFSLGMDVMKVCLITKGFIFKVSVKQFKSGFGLIFGRSWDKFRSFKGVIDGWNIHFKSVMNNCLVVTGYNLEGLSTEPCDNIYGFHHSCLTVSSSLSYKVQIFAKGFFKDLDSRVYLPISVITCNGKYIVDGHVISDKVYGFDGASWEFLYFNEI